VYTVQVVKTYLALLSERKNHEDQHSKETRNKIEELQQKLRFVFYN